MSFNIEVTARFNKQLKRLAKKFPSLKNEFKQFLESLENNPKQGNSG